MMSEQPRKKRTAAERDHLLALLHADRMALDKKDRKAVDNREEYLRRKQREAEAKADQADEAAAQGAAIEAQASAELAAASPAAAAIAAAAKAAVADWDKAIQLKVAELQAAAAASQTRTTAASTSQEADGLEVAGDRSGRGATERNSADSVPGSNLAPPVSPSGPLQIRALATDLLSVQTQRPFSLPLPPLPPLPPYRRRPLHFCCFIRLRRNRIPFDRASVILVVGSPWLPPPSSPHNG
jgi:hypothetical protein